MSRFNRFTALRWMYNIIVPPRYRDKLNITEELCALESAVNKVIEVTNNNGKALEAISQDLEDIQFGAGGYYRPAITENEDGSVTFSFVASDDNMPPIEEKTFFLGDMQTITDMLEGFDGDPMAVKNYIDKKSDKYYRPSITENEDGSVTFSFVASDDSMPPIEEKTFFGGMQTIIEMLEGFNGDPMEVKNYIDEMSGGYYTPVFEQNGNTITVSFTASNKMLPALEGYSFTLTSGSPGKSAYEIAVDNGFKGSVEDFFASLKGDTYALTPADKNEIAQAVIEILGGQPVFGYVDEDNNIKLNTGLDVGAYKLYYDDGNGNLIEVGSMTVEEVDDEPEPMTYTVTFVADGVTVATVTYKAVAPSIEEPTVPAKEGYTGAWADYDLSQGGDITVNAVYTKIGGEVTTHTITWVDDDGTVLATDTVADGDTPEYNGTALSAKVVGAYTHNFIGWAPEVGAVKSDTTYMADYADWGYKSGYRIRSGGAEAAQDGVYCTDYIPVSFDDTVYIKGVTKHTTNGYNSIVFYTANGETQIAFTDFTNTNLSYDSTKDVYSFKVRSGFITALVETCGVARFRMSCGSITKDTIITVNEPIE